MEWIDRLNAAMRHIEANLSGEIDLQELGRIACCSSYHFQRMFTYIAGVSLSEYIRRRRMSLAAVELQSGELKVIDAAAKYGYNSPTAFNRAFQSVHGIAPTGGATRFTPCARKRRENRMHCVTKGRPSYAPFRGCMAGGPVESGFTATDSGR